MLKEMKYFFDEHKGRGKYIMTMGMSSAKAATQTTTLGMYWDIVKDAVFFIAYTFFMLVIRGRTGNMDGMPVLVYLYLGLVAWFIISDYLNQGVNCMVKNKGIFTKIKFPILIIPTFEIVAIWIRRLFTFAILIVLLFIMSFVVGFHPHINVIGLLYALIASFIFGICFTLFMSGFFTISKDFRELYRAIVRIQMYFVPIFWSVRQDIGARENVPHWIYLLVSNTPFVHLVNAFRYSIALGEIPPLYSIGIFALVCFVLFAFGCYMQYRLQRIYADFV